MRKALLSAISILLVGTTFVAAQGPGMGRGMMGGQMMHADSGMMKPMRGCGIMMDMASPKSVIPVDDGIIVVVGNKLLKYDQDLNLKKETQIEIDYEEIEARMQRMRQMCPQMQSAPAVNGEQKPQPEQ